MPTPSPSQDILLWKGSKWVYIWILTLHWESVWELLSTFSVKNVYPASSQWELPYQCAPPDSVFVWAVHFPISGSYCAQWTIRKLWTAVSTKAQLSPLAKLLWIWLMLFCWNTMWYHIKSSGHQFKWYTLILLTLPLEYYNILMRRGKEF